MTEQKQTYDVTNYSEEAEALARDLEAAHDRISALQAELTKCIEANKSLATRLQQAQAAHVNWVLSMTDAR